MPEYFYVITLLVNGGCMQSTGTVQPRPGDTRETLFRTIEAAIKANPDIPANAPITYFYLAPNQLGYPE